MNSNPQPTPGPWHVLADPVWKGKHPCHDARFITTSTDVEVHLDDTGTEHGWRFDDPDSTIVATMPDAPNQQANARLIAAAPALLAACKAALDALTDLAVIAKSFYPDNYAQCVKARDLARSAIALAQEGK